MNEETKQLIEDAAKLLGLKTGQWVAGMLTYYNAGILNQYFNPLNPERGDLMKVAMAAELMIEFKDLCVYLPQYVENQIWYFDETYQSLALAILRAASAVYRARGE